MKEKQKVRRNVSWGINKKTPMAIIFVILFSAIAVMGVLLFRIFSTLTRLLERFF